MVVSLFSSQTNSYPFSTAYRLPTFMPPANPRLAGRPIRSRVLWPRTCRRPISSCPEPLSTTRISGTREPARMEDAHAIVRSEPCQFRITARTLGALFVAVIIGRR